MAIVNFVFFGLFNKDFIFAFFYLIYSKTKYEICFCSVYKNEECFSNLCDTWGYLSMNSHVTQPEVKCFPKETTSKQFVRKNSCDSGSYVCMNSLLEDNNSEKEIATYQTA